MIFQNLFVFSFYFVENLNVARRLVRWPWKNPWLKRNWLSIIFSIINLKKQSNCCSHGSCHTNISASFSWNLFDSIDWSVSQGAFINVSFDRELCVFISRGGANIRAAAHCKGIRSDQTVLGSLQSISEEKYNQRKHWQDLQTRKQSRSIRFQMDKSILMRILFRSIFCSTIMNSTRKSRPMPSCVRQKRYYWKRN